MILNLSTVNIQHQPLPFHRISLCKVNDGGLARSSIYYSNQLNNVEYMCQPRSY